MDDSPLQMLSPELRNTIYELVLYQPDGVVVSVWDGRPQLKRRAEQRNNPLALTQTCKQVREESVLLFYYINCFQLRSYQLDEVMEKEAIDSSRIGWRGGLQKWIGNVGKFNLSQIGQLEIWTGHWKLFTDDFSKIAGRSIQKLQSDLEDINIQVNITMNIDWGDGQFYLKLPLNNMMAARRQLESVLQDHRKIHSELRTRTTTTTFRNYIVNLHFDISVEKLKMIISSFSVV